MPYPGVPEDSEQEKKIERCVNKVMADNPSFDKSKAIAICRASIEKKETEMAKTKKGLTARQRRKQRKEEDDELLKDVQAGIPLEELYDEDFEENELLPPDSMDDLLEEADDMIEELALELEEPESIEAEELDEPELVEAKEIEEEIPAEEDKTEIREKIISIIDLPEVEVYADELDEFDFDLASIAMLIAIDEPTPIEKMKDWIAKAMLTSSARTSLKDSDFALVVKRDGKTVRKYPIHDKAHVRNALARAAQMIKRGGQAASDARAALGKIRAAAKKFGIGQPSKKNHNAIIVTKDADGFRFVGWLSGKWIDLEKDILSEESHKEFVQYLDDHPEYEINFRSYHMPGTEREHPIDFWTYENGFVIVSGKLTEPEAVRLMKAMQKRKIGMSHGFFGVRDITDSRIIRKYRTFEVSDLPLDKAAFPWSGLSTLMEAKSMKTQLQYLSETVGADKLKAILEDTELKKQFLEQTGIEEKTLDAFMSGEEVPEEEETKEIEQEESPELSDEMVSLLKASLGLDGIDLTEIKEAIEKQAASAALLPVLMQKIETLSDELKESKKSADEQLISLLSGNIKNRKNIQDARASGSDDNAPDEELEKALPKHENSWLSEVTKTQPVT